MTTLKEDSPRAKLAVALGAFFATPAGAVVADYLRTELVENVLTVNAQGQPVVGDLLQRALGQRELAIKLLAAPRDVALIDGRRTGDGRTGGG